MKSVTIHIEIETTRTKTESTLKGFCLYFSSSWNGSSNRKTAPPVSLLITIFISTLWDSQERERERERDISRATGDLLRYLSGGLSAPL